MLDRGGQGGGRKGGELLAGAAFPGDEDADALDELGGGAGAFGEKGIGGATSVEVGDGAGGDHGGEGWAEVLGAADELVAVHTGHEEVAEKEVEGAGGGALDDLDGGVRGPGGEDAVAAGFEQKGADGQAGFVVVDAEDGLLGAHACWDFLPGSPLGLRAAAVWRMDSEACEVAGPRDRSRWSLPGGDGRMQARGGACSYGVADVRDEALLSAPLGAVPPIAGRNDRNRGSLSERGVETDVRDRATVWAIGGGLGRRRASSFAAAAPSGRNRRQKGRDRRAAVLSQVRLW